MSSSPWVPSPQAPGSSVYSLPVGVLPERRPDGHGSGAGCEGQRARWKWWAYCFYNNFAIMQGYIVNLIMHPDKTWVLSVWWGIKCVMNTFCLKKCNDWQFCADGGKLFHRAIVCGKNDNWWAFMAVTGLSRASVLVFLRDLGRFHGTVGEEGI